MALNVAIKGSILAEPEACFVIRMALPLPLTQALATAHAIKLCLLTRGECSDQIESSRLPSRSGPSTIVCGSLGKVPWPVSSEDWQQSLLQTLSATPALWGATRAAHCCACASIVRNTWSRHWPGTAGGRV